MRRGQPLGDQCREVEIGRDEANVSVPLEHTNSGVGGELLHQAGLLYRWNEAVLIGCKEERRYLKGGQPVTHIVVHQDAESIDIAGLGGRFGEVQETAHLGLCRMTRVEPKCGDSTHQLHRLPWDDAQPCHSQPKASLWPEEGEGIEDDQVAHSLWASGGEAHGKRTSKGLAHQRDWPVGSCRLEHGPEIVHQSFHGPRRVAQPVCRHAVSRSEKQRPLTVEERSGPVDSRHIKERGAGAVDLQSRLVCDFAR